MLFISLFPFVIMGGLTYYMSALFFANKRLRMEIKNSREEFTQREALMCAGAKVIAAINGGRYDHFCNSFIAQISRKLLVEFVENAIDNKINQGINENHFPYEINFEPDKAVKIGVYCGAVGTTRYADITISKVETYREKANEDQAAT